MIIITRPDVTEAEIDHIRERVESFGLRTHVSRGEQPTSAVGTNAPLTCRE